MSGYTSGAQWLEMREQPQFPRLFILKASSGNEGHSPSYRSPERRKGKYGGIYLKDLGVGEGLVIEFPRKKSGGVLRAGKCWKLCSEDGSELPGRPDHSDRLVTRELYEEETALLLLLQTAMIDPFLKSIHLSVIRLSIARDEECGFLQRESIFDGKVSELPPELQYLRGSIERQSRQLLEVPHCGDSFLYGEGTFG